MALKHLCQPNSLTNCSHEWAGIPNRAFGLASVGDPSLAIVPIGVEKSGDIWMRALIRDDRGLSPGSNFVDLRAAVQFQCREMASTGASAGGAVVSFSDCDSIWRAFNVVGVPGGESVGYVYDGKGMFGWKHNQSQYVGERLYNGCTIKDQILWYMDHTGRTATSNISQGNSVTLDNAGAYVIYRASDYDAEAREVTYRIWSTWYNDRYATVFQEYNRGAGITDDKACEMDNPAATQRRYQTALEVNEWSDIGLDGSKDTYYFDLGTLPAGCKVISVSALEEHKDGSRFESYSDVHGNHGWTVLRDAAAAPNELKHSVHWWHDAWAGVFVRTLYKIQQDPGANCDMPGLTPFP